MSFTRSQLEQRSPAGGESGESEHRGPSTGDTAKPSLLGDGRRVQSSLLSGRSCEATIVEEMERSLNALNEDVLVDYK
jgi:hypothetical protein